MPLPRGSNTWPSRAGSAERVVCKGLNRWRSEFPSPQTRKSASLGLRFPRIKERWRCPPFLVLSVSVARSQRICSRLPQLSAAPLPHRPRWAAADTHSSGRISTLHLPPRVFGGHRRRLAHRCLVQVADPSSPPPSPRYQPLWPP